MESAGSSLSAISCSMNFSSIGAYCGSVAARRVPAMRRKLFFIMSLSQSSAASRGLVIEAVAGEVLLFALAEFRQRLAWADLGARCEDGVDECNRRHVGPREQGTADRGDQMAIAVHGDGRRRPIGDAERRHASFARADRRFDRFPETSSEADDDQ